MNVDEFYFSGGTDPAPISIENERIEISLEAVVVIGNDFEMGHGRRVYGMY